MSFALKKRPTRFRTFKEVAVISSEVPASPFMNSTACVFSSCCFLDNSLSFGEIAGANSQPGCGVAGASISIPSMSLLASSSFLPFFPCFTFCPFFTFFSSGLIITAPLPIFRSSSREDLKPQVLLIRNLECPMFTRPGKKKRFSGSARVRTKIWNFDSAKIRMEGSRNGAGVCEGILRCLFYDPGVCMTTR